MGLNRRLSALDDAFEGRLNRVAPDEGSKERLGTAAGLAVVAIIGLARVIGGDTPVWAVLFGSALFAVVVVGHARALRRRRERAARERDRQ